MPETITLNIAQQMADQLHIQFGRDAPPPILPSSGANIAVPKWIAHRLYRCLLESLDQDLDVDRCDGRESGDGLQQRVDSALREAGKHTVILMLESISAESI